MFSIQKEIIFVQLFQIFMFTTTANKNSELSCDLNNNDNNEYLKWTNNLSVLLDQDKKGKLLFVF